MTVKELRALRNIANAAREARDWGVGRCFVVDAAFSKDVHEMWSALDDALGALDNALRIARLEAIAAAAQEYKCALLDRLVEDDCQKEKLLLFDLLDECEEEV